MILLGSKSDLAFPPYLGGIPPMVLEISAFCYLFIYPQNACWQVSKYLYVLRTPALCLPWTRRQNHTHGPAWLQAHEHLFRQRTDVNPQFSRVSRL